MLRTLLTLMLIATALLIAITGVLPAPGPGAASVVEPKGTDEITWRRTDEGWVMADEWLSPQPTETAPAQPHIHPFTPLPLVVVISLLALLLDRPHRPAE